MYPHAKCAAPHPTLQSWLRNVVKLDTDSMMQMTSQKQAGFHSHLGSRKQDSGHVSPRAWELRAYPAPSCGASHQQKVLEGLEQTDSTSVPLPVPPAPPPPPAPDLLQRSCLHNTVVKCIVQKRGPRHLGLWLYGLCVKLSPETWLGVSLTSSLAQVTSFGCVFRITIIFQGFQFLSVYHHHHPTRGRV